MMRAVSRLCGECAVPDGRENEPGCPPRGRWCFADGKPIKYPEEAFKQAATRADHPDLIIHDLKRSAVRNLSRLGIS